MSLNLSCRSTDKLAVDNKTIFYAKAGREKDGGKYEGQKIYP
jgi:hypothetical protein